MIHRTYIINSICAPASCSQYTSFLRLFTYASTIYLQIYNTHWDGLCYFSRKKKEKQKTKSVYQKYIAHHFIVTYIAVIYISADSLTLYVSRCTNWFRIGSQSKNNPSAKKETVKKCIFDSKFDRNNRNHNIYTAKRKINSQKK